MNSGCPLGCSVIRLLALGLTAGQHTLTPPAARAALWRVASLRLPLPHPRFLPRFHLPPPSVTGKQRTLLRMLTGTHLKAHVPVARALAQLHLRGPVPAAGGVLSPMLS